MMDYNIAETYFGKDKEWKGYVRYDRLWLCKRSNNEYNTRHAWNIMPILSNSINKWKWHGVGNDQGYYSDEKTLTMCVKMVEEHINCKIPDELIESFEAVVLYWIIEQNGK